MAATWSTDELLAGFGAEIIKWQVEGFGRRKIAALIQQMTDRPCSEHAVRRALARLASQIQGSDASDRPKVKIIKEEDPFEEEPIESLIERRVEASKRKIAKAKKHHIRVELPYEPMGIMVFGDPHVDNEGCDWDALRRHVTLAAETDGVLAACVGDIQDNWIGRLARIYADSSVTAANGWRLSEWMFQQLDWIAVVGGNHDAWANGPGVDPMAWLSERTRVMCYAPDEIRVQIGWEDSREAEPVNWILRHDFGGRSWYHPTHGPHKEAMLDGRCHLLTAGHIHQWGQLTTEQRHGRVAHAIRVRGYKRNDTYARAKGFFEQNFGESALVVIDPRREGPGRISVHWDLKRGCEFLTFLRQAA